MDIQTATTNALAELNRSENTKRSYAHAFSLFAAMLAENGISPEMEADKITVQHFIKFPTWLTAHDTYAKSSLQLYLSGVVHLYEYLVLEEVLNPTERDRIRLDKAREKAVGIHQYHLPINRLPKADEVKLIEQAVLDRNVASPLKERDIAIVATLISSAMRVGELVSLKVGDIDLEKCIVLIASGKGDADRIGYIWPETAEKIQSYWNTRGWQDKEDPAFARHDKRVSIRHEPMSTASVRNVINEVGDIAGVEITPHCFRHYAATRILEQTGDISMAQQLLGHRNITTTRRYAETSNIALRDVHSKMKR